MDVDARDDNFTVLRSNGQYFLTEDDDGFAIWSVRADNEEPVLTFPAGEDALPDAVSAFRRETRLARWSLALMIASIVSAIAWVTSALATQILQLDAMQQRLTASFGRSWRPAAITQAVSTVGYSVFVVCVGLFVVLWLHRRYRREG